MIEQKKLKELVKLMVDNDLTELDLQDEKERVALKRSLPHAQAAAAPVAMSAPMHVAAPQAPMAPAAFGGAGPAAAPEREAGLIAIVSPMVGTYYAAPSPDAANFVSVGTPVTPETVVCIVEAMKVFNEIKAETSGKIEKIMVETGQAVEFGQELYLVRPG